MSTSRRPAARRIPGLAALCVGGALALPAAAPAATTSIVAGPLKVKDYTMTVSGADSTKDTLSVLLTRKSGKASQTHFYTFTNGVKITTKRTLAAARIKASLGAFGKIDLKLTGVGAAKRGVTPKGCTGKAGVVRSGTLKGTFKLVADTTYFKTISARSLKAQLARGGSIKCSGTGTGGDGGSGGSTGTTMLSSSIPGPNGTLMFTTTKDAAGAVTQQAIRSDDPVATPGASVMHIISTPGTSANFAPAADLRSATGSGVSPFFSGAFSFSGEPMGTMASGALSGDLAAKFDSIGTQQIASGSPDAFLIKS